MLPSPRLLAAARVLAGATQQELARKAGLAVTSLRRAEFGAVGVRARTVDKLMRALVASGITFELRADRMGIFSAVSADDTVRRATQPKDDGEARRVGIPGTSGRKSRNVP